MSNRSPLRLTAAAALAHAARNKLPVPEGLQGGKKRATKARNVRSVLEVRFSRIWCEAGGPELIEEHRFHSTRRWRFDFAHRESMTSFEIDGGAFSNGRHNRGTGMVEDCRKYLEAQLLGWRVIRLTSPQLTTEIITRIIAAVRCDWKP